MPKYDAMVRIRVIGDTQAGKSNLLNRFIKNEYTDGYLPGSDGSCITLIEGQNVNSQLSETKKDHRGVEKYEDLDKVDTIILVCDLTSQASFDKMKQLYSQSVSRFANNSTPVIIIANKSDQSKAREVSSEALKTFAENCNQHRSCQYFEASAKTGENVNAAFKCAVKEAMYERKILHRLSSEQHKEIEKIVHLLNPENRKKLPFGIGQKRFEAMALEKVNTMINKLSKQEVKAYQAELKRQIPANTKKLSTDDKVRFDLSQKLDERKNAIEKAEQTFSDKNRLARSD